MIYPQTIKKQIHEIFLSDAFQLQLLFLFQLLQMLNHQMKLLNLKTGPKDLLQLKLVNEQRIDLQQHHTQISIVQHLREPSLILKPAHGMAHWLLQKLSMIKKSVWHLQSIQVKHHLSCCTVYINCITCGTISLRLYSSDHKHIINPHSCLPCHSLIIIMM